MTSRIRGEIRELRQRLNQLNDQKESLFEKKKEIGLKIQSSINSVRGLREKRNALTSNVRESKSERHAVHNKLKEKYAEFNELKKKKEGIKHKFGQDPLKIRNDIERLQMKIETEAMSFSNEQKIMKTITQLKKRYDSLSENQAVWEKMRSCLNEISVLKKEADECHRKVTESAKESQEKHEDFVGLSNTIDELKKKEEEILAKIQEKKEAIASVSAELKEKLSRISEEEAAYAEKKKERESRAKDGLKNEIGKVEEKIRKGEKLTTEDILVLQGADENS